MTKAVSNRDIVFFYGMAQFAFPLNMIKVKGTVSHKSCDISLSAPGPNVWGIWKTFDLKCGEKCVILLQSYLQKVNVPFRKTSYGPFYMSKKYCPFYYGMSLYND